MSVKDQVFVSLGLEYPSFEVEEGESVLFHGYESVYVLVELYSLSFFSADKLDGICCISGRLSIFLGL